MSVSFAQLSAIMGGGAVGAAARYMLTTKITAKLGSEFPYGTLTVNVLGSFTMGLLAMLIIERADISPLIKLAIFVGFLGSFTTFSTFSMETMNLLDHGHYTRALNNIVLSVGVSIAAVWLGLLLGKALN